MSYDFTKIKKNLEGKGYAVSVFSTPEEAVSYLKGQVNGLSVGFGGSVTLKEIDLYSALSENNTVLWHDKMPEGMTVAEVRAKAARSDVYFSSVNGISEDGEIINIDHTGNRVAAISYGVKKVYLVIGTNKIAPTYDQALFRARNVASPRNAKRLGRKTPCAFNADRCYNCKSSDRICRNLSVFWEKPAGAEYEIIFIDKSLGF